MEYHATVFWQRTSDRFTYDAYNRAHEWRFREATIAASAAPEYRGDPRLVNPEEAFIASLSACHMLTFLAIAAKRRLSLDSYSDEAVGYLEKNASGRLAVTRVVLRPRVQWSDGVVVPEAELEKMHQEAHDGCFIANSVKTDVQVEPQP